MAEWLVVAGVSILILATLGLVKRAASRGHGVLLFLLPLAGLRQVRDNWEVYGRLALLRVLAVVCALAGLALIGAHQPPFSHAASATGQVLSGTIDTVPTTFVDSQQVALLMARGEGRALAGRVHGEQLQQPRVSLLNGVLNISQGEGPLAGLSLSLMLGWHSDEIRERRTLLINPADTSGPDIHISWRPAGHSYPETRIFHDGYRLQLILAPLGRHQLSGSLQVVLPDSRQSYLVGDFTAYINHLRFLDGQVDLTFDHPDTLGYVTEQYLHTQYAAGRITSVEVENIDLRRAGGEGTAQARVTLKDGSVERQRLALEKSIVGWAVTPGSLHTEQLLAGAQPADDPRAQVPTTAAARPPAAERRLERLADLTAYLNQSLTVVEIGGRRTRGRLTGVNNRRLQLEINLGAGRADIELAATRLAAVELADGNRLLLGEPRKPVAAIASAAPAEPARPFQALVGRRVELVLNDGARRAGVLRRVADDHIALAVPIGAGSVEYLFDLPDIASLSEAP